MGDAGLVADEVFRAGKPVHPAVPPDPAEWPSPEMASETEAGNQAGTEAMDQAASVVPAALCARGRCRARGGLSPGGRGCLALARRMAEAMNFVLDGRGGGDHPFPAEEGRVARPFKVEAVAACRDGP